MPAPADPLRAAHEPCGGVPVAAVDVGGTSIKAAVVRGGRAGRVLREPVRGLGPEAVVAAVLDVVARLVAGAASAGAPARALGLAVPGLVDEAAGVALSSMALGWRRVPFVDLLAERHGLPVAFSHDVTAGAYGESVAGAAVGLSDWLFVALGTGLGTAFVVDGRPRRGATGRGGELAHVVVDPAGPRCPCGKRGCAEVLCSASAVEARYAAATGTRATAAQVAAAAAGGDAAAARVWSSAVRALATVLSGYCEAMDPALVVVGGGLAQAGDQLLRPLADLMGAGVRYASTPTTPVAAALGDLAALHGVARAAAALVASGERSGHPFSSGPEPH